MTDYDLATVENYIKHDLLVFFYHNPLLVEKKEEVSHMYHYFFGSDISFESVAKPFIVLTQSDKGEAQEPLYDKVAFEVLTSLGWDSFTNPDMKTAGFQDVLYHSVRCDNEQAVAKINHIAQRTNPVIASFVNVEGASPEVLQALQKLNDLPQTGNTLMVGYETAQTPTNTIPKELEGQVRVLKAAAPIKPDASRRKTTP